MTHEEFLKKYGTVVGTEAAVDAKNEEFLRRTQTVATSGDEIDELVKAAPAGPTGETGETGPTGDTGATEKTDATGENK